MRSNSSSLSRKIFSSVVLSTLLASASAASDASASSAAAQQRLNDRLIVALTAKHLSPAAVRSALAAGAQANSVDSTGEYALSLAVENGTTDIVEALLAKGARPDAKDTQGTTALMAAATGGQTDDARLLLARHAAADLRDSQGDTALLLASGSGHTQIVKLLLDAGAKVSAQNIMGETPLMMAAQTGQTLAAELLVQHGASATARDARGETPLVLAAQAGQTEFAEFLLKHGASLEDKDGSGRTPLLAAVSMGQAETVAALLKLHADPNLRGDDGISPLVAAAQAGRIDIIKLLVADHADTEQADREIGTPLIAAVRSGSLDAMRTLLQLGARVDGRDDNGGTALIVSGGYKRVDVADLLLQKGADVNAVDHDGNVSLDFAVIDGSLPLIKFLIAHGAGVKATNSYGSLINLAVSQHNEPLALARLAIGAPFSPQDARGYDALASAAGSNDAALVKALIAHRANLESRTNDRETPLIVAAVNSRLQTAELLAGAGADLTATDKFGMDALAWAKYRHDAELTSFLEREQADANAHDSSLAESSPQNVGASAKPGSYESVDGKPSWSKGLVHAWLLTEGSGDSLKDSVPAGETLINRLPTDYPWDNSGAASDSPAVNAKLAGGANFFWTPVDQMSSWTIAVKMRPIGGDGGPSDSRCLWRDGNNWGTALYLYKGTQGFYIGGNPGHNIISYPITPGDDYLVVVDNLGDLYVNGKSAGTFPVVLDKISAGQFSWMSDGFGQGFGGLWYFARVWDRDLTPAEVANFSRNPYADLPKHQ